MSNLRKHLIHSLLGITPYPQLPHSPVANKIKTAPSPKKESLQPKTPVLKKEEKNVEDCLSLDALKLLLSEQKIALNSQLTKFIFADGKPGPVFVLGEAPGAQEETQGKPFVGRSGQLLMQMFSCIQLTREHLYISNVSPWRPPENRTPSNQEIEVLRPFVLQHIFITKPKIVIAVGSTPLFTLFRTELGGITKARGRWHTLNIQGESFPTIPIFHPAYLLRNPFKKKEAWSDMLTIREKLENA